MRNILLMCSNMAAMTSHVGLNQNVSSDGPVSKHITDDKDYLLFVYLYVKYLSSTKAEI
jgi:hypothetical protein